MTGRTFSGVQLTPQDAAILWQGANLDNARINARSRDGALYQILHDIYRAALAYRVSLEGKPVEQFNTPAQNGNTLTPGQVAQQCGVTSRTVRNDIRDGKLPATKVGRYFAIRETDATIYQQSRGGTQ